VVDHLPQTTEASFAFQDGPDDPTARRYRIFSVDASGRRASSRDLSCLSLVELLNLSGRPYSPSHLERTLQGFPCFAGVPVGGNCSRGDYLCEGNGRSESLRYPGWGMLCPALRSRRQGYRCNFMKPLPLPRCSPHLLPFIHPSAFP
jgi:hypothetical protein